MSYGLQMLEQGDIALAIDPDEDDEDAEDDEIRVTDSLLVVAITEDEYSHLEVGYDCYFNWSISVCLILFHCMEDEAIVAICFEDSRGVCYSLRSIIQYTAKLCCTIPSQIFKITIKWARLRT